MKDIIKPIEETPRYEHDCSNCIFLGMHLQYDLYYCPQGNLPTVIARFSDKGEDYQSGLYSISSILDEARNRAFSRGLIKSDVLNKISKIKNISKNEPLF